MDVILGRLSAMLTSGEFRAAMDPAAVRDWFGRDDAIAYFAQHDPVGVAVESPWGALSLVSLDGLGEAQLGYAVGSDGEPFPSWPSGMQVVAAIEGDPIMLDPTRPGEVFHAIHGIGRWEPVAVAGDLEQFFALVLAWCDMVRELGDAAIRDFEATPKAIQRFRDLAAQAGVPQTYVQAALDQR